MTRRTLRRSRKVKCDKHHLLWPRADWSKGTYACKLREHWYFQVFIPAETVHAVLHKEIMCIPVPKETEAKGLYFRVRELERQGKISKTDAISSRLNLLESGFTGSTKKALATQRDFFLFRGL